MKTTTCAYKCLHAAPNGLLHRCVSAFAFLLILAAASPEARARQIGTMSFNYTLNLSFAAGDFLSPRILYSSTAETVVSHTGPFGGGALASGTYPIVYDVPNFPLPTPSSTPVGGFLAYYSFTEFMGGEREGAFVGLSPSAVPSGTFNDLFERYGVTEDQYLSVLKTGSVSETMDMFLAMGNSGLLPTWSYEAGSDSWSIEMNIYAFSEPQLAGTISGGVVATPNETVPDGSSTLLLAAMGLMSLSVAAKFTRPPTRPGCRR